MQHPLLTALFDAVLIGTAVSVIAALVAEHIAGRRPAVGTTRFRAVGSCTGRPARRSTLTLGSRQRGLRRAA